MHYLQVISGLVLGIVLWSCKSRDDGGSAVKIVEGEKVQAGDPLAASVVLLKTPTGGGGFARCSGTLLDSGYVLSAAHCFNRSFETTVVIGSGTRPSEQQLEIPGVAVIHPLYRPLSVPSQSYALNDIALVKIPANSLPPELAGMKIGDPADVQIGSDVIIAGYGAIRNLTVEPGSEQKDELLQTVPNETGELYRGRTRIETLDRENKQIFFRSDNRLTSSCYGDSGGPMLVAKGQTWVVIGVGNSARIEDADSLRYCKGTGMYANAVLQTEWIRNVTQAGATRH